MITTLLTRGLGMTSMQKATQELLKSKTATALATYAEVKTAQSLFEDGKLAADKAAKAVKQLSDKLDKIEYDPAEFRQDVMLDILK